MEHQFQARLISKGPKGAWVYFAVPFDVQKVFGKKSRVPVSGTINGFPFQNSLLPEGDGTHSMMVGKELREGANASAGDIVAVTMMLDQSERVVQVPQELQEALDKDKKAAAAFNSFSYSHKKEYADWISSAKRAETKSTRIVKAVQMLRSGQFLR